MAASRPMCFWFDVRVVELNLSSSVVEVYCVFRSNDLALALVVIFAGVLVAPTTGRYLPTKRTQSYNAMETFADDVDNPQRLRQLRDLLNYVS